MVFSFEAEEISEVQEAEEVKGCRGGKGRCGKDRRAASALSLPLPPSLLLRPLLPFLRQRRLLQVRSDADDGVDGGSGNGNFERCADAGVQIEVLRINSNGGKAGEHSAGRAGNGRSENSFEPAAHGGHGSSLEFRLCAFN